MKKINCPLICFVLASPLFAQSAIEKELGALRQMSLQLLNRIDQLERQQESALEAVSAQKSITPLLDKTVILEKYHSPKGIVELSSNDTTMTLGGRIEFNTYFSNPDVGPFFDAVYKPAVAGESKQLSTDARDSRLWVKTQTPTEIGVLKSLIELDFWSGTGNERNTNSHAPRLRHAYVTLNGFTLGQTYSLFTTVHTPDLIIDPVNEVYARQPLLSWGDGDSTFRYDFSVEEPETTLTDYTGVRVLPEDDRFPDFAARAQYYAEWGELSGALILRQIRQDHATVNGIVLTNSDDAYGWGINTSAKIAVAQRDDIRLGFQYGNALGRYFAEGAYNAGSINALGHINLQVAYGANIAYRHWWNGTLHSTVAYNKTEAYNNHDIVPFSVSKKADSKHINFIWTPIANTLVGFEYAHINRENEQNQHNNLDQFKLRFRYDF